MKFWVLVLKTLRVARIMDLSVRAYLFLKKIPPYAALLDPMRLLILSNFQNN